MTAAEIQGADNPSGRFDGNIGSESLTPSAGKHNVERPGLSLEELAEVEREIEEAIAASDAKSAAFNAKVARLEKEHQVERVRRGVLPAASASQEIDANNLLEDSIPPFPALSEWSKSISATTSWLCDLLIPLHGMTLLAAYMKAGKTTMLGLLLGRLVEAAEAYHADPETGGKIVTHWLGHPIRSAPWQILWANPENNANQLRDILVNAHVDLKQSDRYIAVIDHTWPGWREIFTGQGSVNFGGIKKLTQSAAARGFNVVVFDTGNSIFARAGGESENDNTEVARFAASLYQVCDYQGTVLVNLHTSKNVADENALKSIRGAGAWIAHADQILLLSHLGRLEDPRRRLRIVGRYDESPEKLLVTYDKATRQYRLLDEHEAEAVEIDTTPVSEAMHTVAVNTILENPTITNQKALALKSGKNKEAFLAALRRMILGGEVLGGNGKPFVIVDRGAQGNLDVAA